MAPRGREGREGRRTRTSRAAGGAPLHPPMPEVADGPEARPVLPALLAAAGPTPDLALLPQADIAGLEFDGVQVHDSDRFAMGMVTTLLLLCVACLGGCSVYTCLRAWSRYHALSAPAEKADPESPLPNYTLVSGLPTYDEALDQLQQRRELRRSSSAQRAIELAVAAARAAGNLMAVRRLQNIRHMSVGDLIQYTFRSNSFDKR
ncbi:protein commissureless 2 homolog [Frankliniella occidentalis]|uniref:Protein commissureless 2 homolog n=1 Tax=Frankliniella occidentalis TaxID=133901 RepID=A0A9C6X2S1_FRAOC|nr:protein commissureless 2 homolog [Frankliniella occidentalis]